jgi:hypothetical protein
MPLLLQVPDAWRAQARSPAAAWASRAAVVLGGVVVLGSMFLQWGYDRSVVPNVALDAWQQYPRADLVLALVGVLVVASAALPAGAVGVAARAAASLLAAAFVLWLMRAGSPGVGARVALLGALVALAGAAAAVVAEPSLTQRLRTATRSNPAARRGLRIVTSSWLLGLVIGVVTFPLKSLQPGGGTDSSWVAALHMAADRGLSFGTDVVFTYGPLGFLTVPRLHYVWTAALGVAYMLVVQVALATTMIAAARRALPLIVAVAVAGLACAAVGETTPVAVAGIVFCGSVAALASPQFGASRWLLPALAGAGVLAAMQALVKLNSGLIVIALVATAAAVATPRARWATGAAALVGGFVVGLLAFWLALGQDLGALPSYVHQSVEVLNGFAEYQYREEDTRQWEYDGALLAVLALGVVLVHASRGLTRPRIVALWLATAGYAFVWFKQGFVRHDAHSIDFFVAMLLAAIGLCFTRRVPGTVAVLALSALLMGYFATARPIPWEWLRQADGWRKLTGHVDELRHPDAFVADWRSQLQDAEGIDPATLALVRGKRTHVFPSETAVAWAYPELRWRPLPVFQGYQAYTDELDRLNAESLIAPDGPERLLRTTEYSPFEDPRTVREVFCRYRELRATDRWQVLAREPTRCGPPRSLGTHPLRVGEELPVPAPAPGEAVLMALHGAGPDAGERLRALVYKPYDRWISIDGERQRRFAIGLATVPTLLRVADDVDYTDPFRMDDKARRIRLVITSEGVLGMAQEQSRNSTVEFFSMPVTAPATLGS